VNFISLHWIRPELWWTAIPLLICALLLARQQGQQRAWQKHIDPSLLPYLLDGKSAEQGRHSSALLFLAAGLCWLALLGPAWQQLPSPLYKNSDALVVVLDLSPSMLAEDIQPSRIRQARFKLRDILQLRADGQTGLVVFSGDAFVVAPLTDDINTLLTLIPGLYPEMMPMMGSNPLAGLKLAANLLDQSGGKGRILLISDGVNDEQLPGLTNFLDDKNYSLSVLAVGSRDGAPIPLPDGGFARDDGGSIIVPGLTERELRQLANSAGGKYRELSLDGSDIQALALHANAEASSDNNSQRNYEQWKDAGPWLVLLLLPIALLGFKRSWLPSLLLPLLLTTQSPSANALDFDHLWSTPDQQGAALIEKDPKAAAEHFENPLWRGSAQYRAGDFAAAADSFATADSADAHYNRGNALAKAGKLDEAITAYDAALSKDPELSDAKKNKKLLEDLKKQQDQQEQNKQDQPDSQDNKGDQQNKDKQQGGDQQGQQDPDSQQSDGDQSDSEAGDNKQDQNQPASADDEAKNPSESKSQDPSSAEQSVDAAAAQKQAEQKAADDYARQAAEQSEAQQASAGKEGDEQAENGQAVATSDAPLSEEQQAQEQWLRKIPDNPGNLLRNKFQYQHQQRQRRGEQTERNDYAPY
jgi:Ca-activated chloride channel family protein